jgi:hypothetical protein
MTPVLLIAAAVAAVIFHVEGDNAYPVRNCLPLLVVILLSFLALWLGDGEWSGNGWRWPLGIVGFAIPAVGLSLYLHYGYAVNMNEMFSGSENAIEVFRYLPAYTSVSGALGFAIGLIVGARI